jgi:hypothetical protein
MCALAATVQNQVAVSQSKSVGYKGRNERDICSTGRDVGDTGKAFAAPAHFQVRQLEPCQPSLEIAGTRYGEVDTCIAE